MIIYSKFSGTADSAIGRLENPIKMIIEHESDLMKKKGGVCDWLFNVEKSNRYGETIVGQSEFGIFQAVNEGSGAEVDNVYDTYTKFIEHIQFMKEFVITAEMMEDASGGIAAEAKRRAENFTRAYYKTVNDICARALANGTARTMNYAKANIDLTTGDSLPLFHKSHKWGANAKTGTQANYFWGDVFSSGTADARTYKPEALSETLANLSYKMRDMRDENGDQLGYIADTIILPSNRPKIESMVKSLCASEGVVGSANNDRNLHYGNWNVIVLPQWYSDDDRMMIMSSEANRNLSGNMFYNRVPLTVSNWVDNHTGNYIWNGRCRFGVGFGSYKHILMAVDSTGAVNGAETL